MMHEEKEGERWKGSSFGEVKLNQILEIYFSWIIRGAWAQVNPVEKISRNVLERLRHEFTIYDLGTLSLAS